MGGDSSDADTQEPVKGTMPEESRVPESDEEAVGSPAGASPERPPDGKMRRVIDSINADGERSDDEDVEVPDAPVDFGDEEEEDVDEVRFETPKLSRETTPPSSRGGGGKDPAHVAEAEDAEDFDIEFVVAKGAPENVVVPKEEIAPQAEADDEVQFVESVDAAPKKPSVTKKTALKKGTAAKKGAGSKKESVMKKEGTVKKEAVAKKAKKEKKEKVSPKKKVLTKKEKDGSPSKTIKKTTAQAKAKANPLKKKAAATKKQDLLNVNVTAITEDGSSGDDKPLKLNSKSKTSPKAAKPKKTIAKDDKKITKKKTLGAKATKASDVAKPTVKKTGLSKNNPTKAKKLLKKQPLKSSKAAVVKTEKGKKSKTIKTKKSKIKVEEDEEDEETPEEAEMEVESDEEGDESELEEDAEDLGADGRSTPAANRPYLACSSRDITARALLDHAVQQLRRYSPIEYGPETASKISAYIVGAETKRGWGVLQALATGVPLISEEWLTMSISSGKWLPMDDFRSEQFGFADESRPANWAGKLFDGLRVNVRCKGKDAQSVRKLAVLTGARVAETRYEVVINDTKKVVAGAVNVSKKWLADSIEAGEPMEYEGYQIEA